jgi:hypothetical protein
MFCDECYKGEGGNWEKKSTSETGRLHIEEWRGTGKRLMRKQNLLAQNITVLQGIGK